MLSYEVTLATDNNTLVKKFIQTYDPNDIASELEYNRAEIVNLGRDSKLHRRLTAKIPFKSKSKGRRNKSISKRTI